MNLSGAVNCTCSILLGFHYIFVVLMGFMANMLFLVFRHKFHALLFVNCFVGSAMGKQYEILVFGGNGFIGSECVKTLLRDGHKVSVVNRGNNYWDYNTRIKPYVSEILCDRNQGLDISYLESKHPGAFFDFVIDFSAFRPNVIKDAFETLQGRMNTYIYISSDSVYEVSEVSQNKFLQETDAVRPGDPNEQHRLNQKDAYGHNKLAGEEWIEDNLPSYGVPYVIFRLPDVIGPRDTTYRWWTYQAWMQVYGSSGKRLLLPRATSELTTSYVYVKDVARVISATISQVGSGNSPFQFQVFNVAHPEEVSLKTLLDSMQKALDLKGIEYVYDEKAYHLLPSVTRGPIDTTKIRIQLPFNFTQWHEAIEETVGFFKDALYKFPAHRNAMIHGLASLAGENLQSVEQKVDYYLRVEGAADVEGTQTVPSRDEL